MKRDAHYYAVLAFSRACGFRKEYAYEIAYASQFVNDAMVDHIVVDGEIPRSIQHDMIGGSPGFSGMATGYSRMPEKCFDAYSMVQAVVPFHFVPGCRGATFEKKLRCREESPVINRILQDALDGTDLIRFGIALHALADSFSHQGFSGILSRVNEIKNRKSAAGTVLTGTDPLLKIGVWSGNGRADDRFDAFLPAFGHAQVLEYPDIPLARWSYQYDDSDAFCEGYVPSGRISNRHRFAAAFDRIQDCLEMFLQRHGEYADSSFSYRRLHVLFEALFEERPFKERERNWRKVLVREGLFDPLDGAIRYDETHWLREAFGDIQRRQFYRRRVDGVRLSGRFATSRWYRFYRAVKWYKKRFFDYCGEYGLDLLR